MIFLVVMATIVALMPLRGFFNDAVTPISHWNGYQYVPWSAFVSSWKEIGLGLFASQASIGLLGLRLLYGITPAIAAWVMPVGWFIVAAVLSYYAMRLVSLRPVIRITGSALYVGSIVGQAFIQYPPSGGLIFFALLPACLYLYYTWTQDNQKLRLALFATIFLFLADTNATYIVLLFVFFALLELQTLARSPWKHCVGRWMATLGIFVVTSSSIILPQLSSLVFFRSGDLVRSLKAETVEWKSSFASAFDALRLAGSLDFNSVDQGGYVKPYYRIFFDNPYVVMATVVVACVGLFGVLVSVKRNRRMAFFLLFVWIVFFSASTGVHGTNPIRSVAEFAFTYVPFWGIFRDPYKSAPFVALVYAFGACMFLEFILAHYGKRAYRIGVTGLSIVVSVILFPFIWNGPWKTIEEISIPRYWHDLAVWSATHQSDKKLLLPSQVFHVFSFTNHRGKHTSVLYNFLGYVGIQEYPGSDGAIADLQRLIWQPDSGRLLGFWGIRYVVNFMETDALLYGTDSPLRIQEILKNTFQEIQSFGDRAIVAYEVPLKFLNPELFIPSRVYNTNANTFFDTIGSVVQSLRGGSTNQVGFFRIDTLPANISTTAEIVSRTVFLKGFQRLVIRQGQAPFAMIFNQRFHQGWLLWSWNSKNKVVHVRANAIMNGFVVTPDGSCVNNCTMLEKYYLVFMPDIYMWFGVFLSVGSVVFLWTDFVRQRYGKGRTRYTYEGMD